QVDAGRTEPPGEGSILLEGTAHPRCGSRAGRPMNRRLLRLLVLVTALSGCSKHATEPTAVAPPAAPPELLSSQPAPRATGVIYDAEIWAQFSRPLDPRTIGPTSVFLKLDGQRVPLAVGYDALSRRNIIRPAATLELQRTYTAEFSTAVHGLDGT